VLASTLERTGSYDVIFRGLAAMVVVLGLGCWFVAVPQRPLQKSGLVMADA
jgi:hypothetical protein